MSRLTCLEKRRTRLAMVKQRVTGGRFRSEFCQAGQWHISGQPPNGERWSALGRLAATITGPPVEYACIEPFGVSTGRLPRRRRSFLKESLARSSMWMTEKWDEKSWKRKEWWQSRQLETEKVKYGVQIEKRLRLGQIFGIATVNFYVGRVTVIC